MKFNRSHQNCISLLLFRFSFLSFFFPFPFRFPLPRAQPCDRALFFSIGQTLVTRDAATSFCFSLSSQTKQRVASKRGVFVSIPKCATV